ncbi:tRNA methyltransferase [Methanosarcina sp. 2.H.T.1A.6]|uniref:class I SAM-dependent methyltransferase n=1 Tax=unclassified Methanosarcina TaxID=2644672 RepID=UPI0006220838|nr:MULTISPECIES: class I SAM-dependent methyltransferase family protein [unclassified Methanosarcina]KKG14793.1 tRNA methyltransferase [Methanosarcina sp. 2.H.T.1A.3]KKG15753.1 tRNA methyltransferase [Methanosarcina sp. 2.H.T.1A.15]KKG23925.1 tRNA methyltransferase [Methanosarcina sp. 2.H.T.1A.6]KKG26437.1 tRNA methyltransferase [Methanosarcina sp. 2.H.T.1A.8]
MKRQCIQIPKKKGESARRVLLDFELLDNSLKIGSDETFLYLPLSRELLSHELADLPAEAELAEFDFEPQEKKPTPGDLLGFNPAYELIGDIALLEDESLDSQTAFKIADVLLLAQPNIKTVVKPLTPVIGEFRIREFEVIAGEPRTETIHREYGCRYKVDLSKAYFTPRLSTERSRILAWVKDGDTVVDMFAGVGPYSILFAKSKKPSKVVAIDKNPDAVRYLRENITLNSAKNIEAIEGDAREEAKRFAGTADHVIMNLPHSAHEFLDSAVLLTKPGGIIHYYGMTHEDDLFESSVELIRKAAEKAGRKIEILEEKVVRSYAPHQYNICIEARVI